MRGAWGSSLFLWAKACSMEQRKTWDAEIWNWAQRGWDDATVLCTHFFPLFSWVPFRFPLSKTWVLRQGKYGTFVSSFERCMVRKRNEFCEFSVFESVIAFYFSFAPPLKPLGKIDLFLCFNSAFQRGSRLTVNNFLFQVFPQNRKYEAKRDQLL